MWKMTTALLTITASGFAVVQTITPEDTTLSLPPPQKKQEFPQQNTMIIPPSLRALDFQQAFEILRKEKSTNKVYFQLSDGSTISNIIDMTLMTNSTLILFRYNSTQGIRFQIVKLEDIINIGY